MCPSVVALSPSNNTRKICILIYAWNNYVSYTLVCVHFIVCSMYVRLLLFYSVIFQSCKFSYPMYTASMQLRRRLLLIAELRRNIWFCNKIHVDAGDDITSVGAVMRGSRRMRVIDRCRRHRRSSTRSMCYARDAVVVVVISVWSLCEAICKRLVADCNNLINPLFVPHASPPRWWPQELYFVPRSESRYRRMRTWQ